MPRSRIPPRGRELSQLYPHLFPATAVTERALAPGWLRTVVDIAQILTALAAIGSIYVAINVANFTVEESERIGWYNTLETRSIEAEKTALDKDVAKCIYDRSDIIDGNEHCIRLIFSNKNNTSEASDYAETLIELMLEAKEYSEEYDDEYFNRWYSQWAKELSADPHGIIGHAMLLQASNDRAKLERMKSAGLDINTTESERRFVQLQRENASNKMPQETKVNGKQNTKGRHHL